MKSISTLGLAFALASITVAQGTWVDVPNWPTSTFEAFAIHQCHLRPANPAMGNKGRFMFWGRIDGNSTEPWIGILRRH